MTLFTPAIIALPSGMLEDGRSGVNKKNGMQNTKSQIAPTGPARRSGSCSAWLTPQSGCARKKPHRHNTGSENGIRMKSRRIKARKMASQRGKAERPARRLWQGIVGKKQLLNHGENSKEPFAVAHSAPIRNRLHP